MTGGAIAWVLLVNAHSAAHANPSLVAATVPSAEPWGLTFDSSGNIWVASPQCDPNVTSVPICTTIQGGIVEYSRQSFKGGASPLQSFTVPSGYSSPFFLAFDKSGNLWFTEPVTNAIGELDTSKSWHQWNVPTSGASPFDLTFDHFGNLWFTEFSANKIGKFNPATHTFNETPTPTPGSRPYGIAGPDPATGSIWFTENNPAVHRIGRFTPGANGINGSIQEYLTNSSNAYGGNTPHLITFDNHGNIWWSEGFAGGIGKLVISQATNGTIRGVSEYNVPQPCANGCGTHISGIAVDSNGTVWFDDSLSSRYGSFVPATSSFTLYILGGKVTNNIHPNDGLAVDSNNNVWMSEEFARKLVEALTGSVANPTPSPTTTGMPSKLPPGPVNTTWYFAEGKVGQNFTEYLTIQNPDPVNACNVNLEYLLGIGAPVNKTLTIAAGTRWTEGVNNDLGTPSGSAAYKAVSTIVTVTNATTCKGVVAERPIYFTNFKGISSGTEVLGATHTSADYYFADVSSAPGHSSYLTILNPPSNKTAASITATYYRGSTTLGTDLLTVQPSTRGTIIPKGFNEQVATWVHSTVPVVVERPTYFNNISLGNAQHISGADSVVGAPAQANDWRFAEGYTGGGFQENLLLANFGKTSANATVILDYANGSTLTNTYAIKAQDLMSVDVNYASSHVVGVCAPTPCVLSSSVSAEITTGAGTSIVAEREILFHFDHFDSGINRTVIAVGGTDVVGQSGAAHATSYSFSEGYCAAGFDEWLTVQNPTTAQETVTTTLINGKGTVYQFSLTVPAHGRGTANITDYVVQHMYHTNDGTAGFQVSMTVRSTAGVFVAERPLYWNAAGTQGASDIIGYIGG
jgi:streptogramin lyase